MTARIDQALREALRLQSTARRRSISDVVRSMLEQDGLADHAAQLLSEAGASTHFFGCKERIPYIFHQIFRDTDTLVVKTDRHRAVAREYIYKYFTTCRHGLHGIDQYIQKGLVKHIGIRRYIRDTRVELFIDGKSFLLGLG